MTKRHKLTPDGHFRDCAPARYGASCPEADAMPLYPLFADLADRAVLVVGGGAVAERKVAALMKCGAEVRVSSPEVGEAIAQWAREARIEWREGRYETASLDDIWLVVAATGDAKLNAEIARDAERRRVLVNVVDDAALSTFHVPAVIDRSPLIVAISSGGAAPMLVRAVRERIESALDHSLGTLATLLERHRERIRTMRPRLSSRRRFYEHVIQGRVAALLRASRPRAAERALNELLSRADERARGEVVLVGAGPGDPGLLTLHALRALNEADVILHDRLVGAGVLDLARRDAERIDVGKRAGACADTQSHIHALMLAHARAGRRVVRLKGGDPFVFGRGGEEIEFLRAHGIAYRVVPGITAALACAAYAGVPLTHRDHAQSVTFATAHGQSLDAIDWPALAARHHTIAFYMSVSELATVQHRLIEHGREANTPYALVENGTQAHQRVVTGTLAHLADDAFRERVGAPALLIVGEVAALASRLGWFGEQNIRDAIAAAA